MKHSDGVAPNCEPVVCPCEFDVDADFPNLVIAGNAEFAIAPPTDPIDLGTFAETCGLFGPNSELSHVADAYQSLPNPLDTPQGVQLYFWVEDDGVNASCNEVGGGQDGVYFHDPTDWDYGPWINRQISISPAQLTACQARLEEICEGL